MSVFIQTSSSDASTNDVIDWLLYLSPGTTITRWNDEQEIGKVTYAIGNDNIHLQIENESGQTIHADEISARWYRRGSVRLAEIPVDTGSAAGFKLSSDIKYYADNELKNITHNIDFLLGKLLHSINKWKDDDGDKITNLIHAAQAGLHIPDSLVTNDMDELAAFANRHGNIITKALVANAYKIDFGKDMYGGIAFDTTPLTYDTILTQMEVYKDTKPLPAFYQAYIDKKFELRIFYLKGVLYPMAIFSQENEQTKIDFRNYDKERPNRCVPYKLPKPIEIGIEAFMQSAGLNCGSIDMIVTPAGDYVFLEVNPAGQFKWLSKNCNYDIEQQIALGLIHPQHGSKDFT